MTVGGFSKWIQNNDRSNHPKPAYMMRKGRPIMRRYAVSVGVKLSENVLEESP